MNQLMSQMSAEERRQAAAMLVRRLTTDLQFTVRRDLDARHIQHAPEATLGDLLAGNDWLFDEGNYHIDVSHLHATVGFARHLKPGDPELPMAIDLCTYGSQLAEPLRYPADVPFDDYYPAHRHFLEALVSWLLFLIGDHELRPSAHCHLFTLFYLIVGVFNNATSTSM